MAMELPRALEFELVGEDWFHVKVDGHAFICRIEADPLSVTQCRVKRGGRRARRPSEHYQKDVQDFAWREARLRGLVRGDARAAAATPGRSAE